MTTLPHPILRYHGGKWRLAPWITEHFPPHKVYVEPFGGAAGVLCRKTRSDAEVYNDLDAEIVNVFRVLRCEDMALRLARSCQLTPYSRDEFELTQKPCDEPVERARRTLFRAWASFGSAGATRGRTGFRTYTNPNTRYTSVTQCWTRVQGLIPAFIERFRDVVIENRPGSEVIAQHDSPQTLFYVDPPYVPNTRAFDGGRYYRHELDDDGHRALLAQLLDVQGMVVLSGYPCALYDKTLEGWRRFEHETCGSSRFGSVKRTECLWLNPAAQRGLPQPDLFPAGFSDRSAPQH